MEQQGDMTRLLPDDALAGVLGRLAPRSIATSRCVCKAWRDIIDARRILRADLLPHSLAGIFINFLDLSYSEFFCRPPPSKGLLGVRERISCYGVEDHCNGLVLLGDSVVEWLVEDDYLVFDPTTSPHYQVFSIPRIPFIEFLTSLKKEINPAMLESEWPPSSYALRVFSSIHGRWEEKKFIRQGPSAGIVADLGTFHSSDPHHAVYRRGALYVHREKYFVIRLSLSNSTYQVIKPPRILESRSCHECYLGKSKKGVYYVLVLLLEGSCQLQVWVLGESCGHPEWMLEHDRDLKLLMLPSRRQVYGPWILQDVNYNEQKHIAVYNDNESTVLENDFEWNSDDDVLDTEYIVDRGKHNGAAILGLHPFKEIVSLDSGHTSRGLAYHLNTSKIEDLGSIYPKYYGYIAGPPGYIQSFFPYTPCWME